MSGRVPGGIRVLGMPAIVDLHRLPRRARVHPCPQIGTTRVGPGDPVWRDLCDTGGP